MAESRPTKVRRLLAGVGIASNQPHVSRLLKRLRETAPEDQEFALKQNRFSLHGALKDLWRQMNQVETFEKLDGSELLLETVSVTRVLQFAAKAADGFARPLGDLWQGAPCTIDSPYHLVIFADEHVPGDVLMSSWHYRI